MPWCLEASVIYHSYADALAGCWLVELALSQQTRVRVLPSSKCNAGRQSASSVSFFLIYHSYCYHTILHGCWAFSYIHDAQSLCQNLYIHSLFQHNWRWCSLFHFLFLSARWIEGWRLDYFLVSESIAEKVHDSYILPDISASDHSPLGLVLKL